MPMRPEDIPRQKERLILSVISTSLRRSGGTAAMVRRGLEAAVKF